MVSCQKRRRESAIFIWLKVQEEKSFKISNEKNNEYDEYYYVEIGDIQDNKISNSTKIKKSDLPKGTKRQPEIGDILICTVRPNSKKIVYYTEHYYKNNLLVSGAIIILRCNECISSLLEKDITMTNMTRIAVFKVRRVYTTRYQEK